MKKRLIALTILMIIVSLSLVLKINVIQYEFSMSGESGSYSSTFKSNFYEISYYLLDNELSFNIGQAKFRVYFTGSKSELDMISFSEIEFNFDPYFRGTHTGNGDIAQKIVKVDYGGIIKYLEASYKVNIRSNNSTEVIELLLNK